MSFDSRVSQNLNGSAPCVRGQQRGRGASRGPMYKMLLIRLQLFHNETRKALLGARMDGSDVPSDVTSLMLVLQLVATR